MKDITKRMKRHVTGKGEDTLTTQTSRKELSHMHEKGREPDLKWTRDLTGTFLKREDIQMVINR